MKMLLEEIEVDVDIRHEGDHYVVYVDGNFYCSADTHYEAAGELHADGFR